MNKPDNPLVYDRSEKDLDRAMELKNKVSSGGFYALSVVERSEWNSGLKASLSAKQLNRMEEWIKYLSECLTADGYIVSVKPGKVWADKERVYQKDIDRIVDNILALRDSLGTVRGWETISRIKTMNIYQANSMEYDLNLCYNLLENMVSVYPHSGQGLVEAGFYFAS